MLRIGLLISDPETTGEYLPFAKSKLRALQGEWTGYFISRAYRVDKIGGGVSILVEMWSAEDGRITLKAEHPYMESGFLDLRGTLLPGEDLTYWPALVKFSGHVAGLSNKPGYPNTSAHKVTNGSETRTSAGCNPSKKLERVEVSIGTQGNTKSFSRAEPTYCEPTALLAGKLLRARISPSCFTGKMRLFVQALYGSARTDFSANPASIYVPLLRLDTHKFTKPKDREATPSKIFIDLPFGYPNTGLFTYGPGQYLLIEIGIDRVTWRKLLPWGKVSPFKSPEQEAYLLSQLVPDDTAHEAVGSGMPGTAAGTPLAYGWHFNERGDEAHITLGKGTMIGGVRAYDRSPNIALGLRFTRYGVGFVFTRTKDVSGKVTESLGYTLSTKESGDHLPFIQTKIFTPNYSTNGMAALLLGSSASALNCYADVGPAPVYCYYKGTELQIVYVNNSSLVTVPAHNDKFYNGVDGPSVNTQNGAEIFPGTFGPAGGMSRTFKATPAGYLFSAHGVWSQTFDFRGVGTNYPGNLQTEVITLPPEVTTYYLIADPKDNSKTILVSITQLQFNGPLGVNTVQVNAAESVTPVLVVPFGDASAVIAGMQRAVSGTVLSAQTGRLGNNVYVSTTDPGLQPAQYSWARAGILIGEAFPTTAVTPNKRESQLNLYSAAGVTSISKYAANETAQSPESFPGRPYTGLFECDLAGVYNYPMTVRSSYFGAVRHDWLAPAEQGQSTGYLNDWPAETLAPIGWA